MSENKTKPIAGDAKAFIEGVESPKRREAGLKLLPLFEEWTGMKPVLWGSGLAGKPGSAIIGFGYYHYEGSGGREGDWMLTGFSPRKANMAIYIMPGFKTFEKELSALGPHKHSVSCLYGTKINEWDMDALGKIVTSSVETMKSRYEWKAS